MKRKTVIQLINFSVKQWIKTNEEKYRTAFYFLLEELKIAET